MTTKVPGFFALDLLDNRFPALHGMRVIAILSVIAYHVTWIFMAEQGIMLDPAFFTQSLAIFFGMDLFFLLSGFLIGSILLRSIATTGVQHIKRFYLRRIFRTFPSYYLVLTFLVLAFGLTHNQRHHLVWEYVYGTNFMPLDRGQTVMFWGWSLALEEQFYLTVPLLFFVLKRLRTIRTRLALVGVLWLAALVVRLVIYYRGAPWNDMELYGQVYFRTHTRFDLLIAGILVALVHQRWSKEITAWLKAPFHRVLLALPALACLWVLLRGAAELPEHAQILRMFLWGTVTSLMYFGLVPLALYGEGWIVRALSLPLFRRLATLGYGVYLVHIPIIDHIMVPAGRAAQARHYPMLLVLPGALASTFLLSLAVAYLLHVVVEKPSLRLRDRLAGP
ncbi:MAG TPA: acyltransferase [Polyangiaceae bacterium]|nr:acyltransferase [Polyangiaceae bacterium]